MSAEHTPADWAIERALGLMEYGGTPLRAVKGYPNEHYEVVAFARYIEAHEQPPVDPVEVKIAAAFTAIWNDNEYGTVEQWAERLKFLLTEQGLEIRERSK